MMKPISYARHRFPADVIRQTVWLYFRFTLSFRDVEDLMAERGIDVSYESVRCWTRKFGQMFAHNLRKSRAAPTSRWHLDEMVVKIGGKRMFLWRAVDDEGEVLDMLVQKRRNKQAALRLLRKLLKRQGIVLRQSSLTDWHPMALQHTNSAVPIVTAQGGCEKTIGRRIHICRSGAGKESNSGSNRRVPPRGFSPPTPLFTTPSTSNVISSAAPLSAISEPRPWRHGTRRHCQHDVRHPPDHFAVNQR